MKSGEKQSTTAAVFQRNGRSKSENKRSGREGVQYIYTHNHITCHVAAPYWTKNNYYSCNNSPPQKMRQFNFQDTQPVKFYTSQTFRRPSTRTPHLPGSTNVATKIDEIHPTRIPPPTPTLVRVHPDRGAKTNLHYSPGFTQERGKARKLYPYPGLPGQGATAKTLPLPGSTRPGGKNKRFHFTPSHRRIYIREWGQMIGYNPECVYPGPVRGFRS